MKFFLLRLFFVFCRQQHIETLVRERQKHLDQIRARCKTDKDSQSYPHSPQHMQAVAASACGRTHRQSDPVQGKASPVSSDCPSSECRNKESMPSVHETQPHLQMLETLLDAWEKLKSLSRPLPLEVTEALQSLSEEIDQLLKSQDEC